MGLLKVLLELLQSLFLFQDIGGIVPFAGSQSTKDKCLLMLELADFLSSTSVKKSGVGKRKDE